MKIPHNIAVAVSGGADSMAVLDFLRRTKDVVALHYNHGTPHAREAEDVVNDYCVKNYIPCIMGSLEQEIPSGVSKEDFWRKSRYGFFENEALNRPIITCHHLDDLVETWLFTSLHGDPKLIPSKRGRYLRPFLITRKSVLEDWCDSKDVSYLEDPTNTDISYMRNYIRHEMVPKALRVNPGLPKVLRKRILNNPLICD
jgi:tRNA(Ile)-lysidine synthase